MPPVTTGAVFVPNLAFGPAVLRSAPMARYIGHLTEIVAELASDSAPYRLGHLSGSVEADVSELGGGIVGRASVSDFKWRWHEFGTWKMSATPFLRPALVAVVPYSSVV